MNTSLLFSVIMNSSSWLPPFRFSELALLLQPALRCYWELQRQASYRMPSSLVGRRWGRNKIEKYIKTSQCYHGNVCSALKVGGKAIVRGGLQERVNCGLSYRLEGTCQEGSVVQCRSSHLCKGPGGGKALP